MTTEGYPTSQGRIAHTETMGRKYKSSGDYGDDAAKLSRQGWVVQSAIEGRGGPHWIPSLLLLCVFIVPGLLALLFWRKRVMIVTYTRTLPG